MTIHPRRRSLISSLARWLAALAGAGLASTAPVNAQGVPPSAAPAEWVRYAESATTTITSWLEADSESAIRLRAYLHQTRPAEDRPTPPLELKVWIGSNGRVSRIAFAPFAHEEANADLRATIVGRDLPSPPPVDMLLPLRIAIQLEPAPAAAPAGGETLTRANSGRIALGPISTRLH